MSFGDVWQDEKIPFFSAFLKAIMWLKGNSNHCTLCGIFYETKTQFQCFFFIIPLSGVASNLTRCC